MSDNSTDGDGLEDRRKDLGEVLGGVNGPEADETAREEPPGDTAAGGTSTDEERDDAPVADVSSSSSVGDGPVPGFDEEPGGPGFPHEAVGPFSVYARDATKAGYKAFRSEVEAYLLREHGAEEVAKREVDDAVLAVVQEHREEVADRVLEERDEEG